MPRDIDPGCGELEGVTLYDIDDLQAVVARNLGTRASEMPRAQELVEEEIHRFARWLGQLDALPVVSALREHANAIVEQVLAENGGRWESASPRDRARVEAIARAIVSRLLHEPTIRLRALGGERGHASLELSASCSGSGAGLPGEPRPAELAEVHDLSDRRPEVLGACAQLMRLGTRRSALALAQAELVATLLGGCEIVPILTAGDRGEGAPRQVALGARARGRAAGGEIDLAVHSAKDVPGELAGGLELLGGAARARPPRMSSAARRGLDALGAGARIGRSSIRRAAQLRAAREDLEVDAAVAATSTRASQSSQRQRSTRSCWPVPASSVSDGTSGRRSTSSCPQSDGDARDRGAGRRRAGRAGDRTASRRRFRASARRRAGARRRARGRLPHADRRSRAGARGQGRSSCARSSGGSTGRSGYVTR